MVCEKKQEEKWQKEVVRLQAQLAYYEQENARLKLQNEALHETAWELIRRIRKLEGKSEPANIFDRNKKKD